MESKQVAEAEAFFISDSVETKQAAEAEVFLISDSVTAEPFLIFLKLWKITCSLREVYSLFMSMWKSRKAVSELAVIGGLRYRGGN